MFAFKGKQTDVRSLGALLGVAVILEGTVRKSGARLRITSVDEKFFRRPPEQMLREYTRADLGLGRGEPRVAQPLTRGGDVFMNRHETAVASLSFSDW